MSEDSHISHKLMMRLFQICPNSVMFRVDREKPLRTIFQFLLENWYELGKIGISRGKLFKAWDDEGN